MPGSRWFPGTQHEGRRARVGRGVVRSVKQRQEAWDICPEERLECCKADADNTEVDLDAGPEGGASLRPGYVGVVLHGPDIAYTDDTDNSDTVK